MRQLRRFSAAGSHAASVCREGGREKQRHYSLRMGHPEDAGKMVALSPSTGPIYYQRRCRKKRRTEKYPAASFLPLRVFHQSLPLAQPVRSQLTEALGTAACGERPSSPNPNTWKSRGIVRHGCEDI